MHWLLNFYQINMGLAVVKDLRGYHVGEEAPLEILHQSGDGGVKGIPRRWQSGPVPIFHLAWDLNFIYNRNAIESVVLWRKVIH